MKLNTNAILSLIGGILVLIGLFIPAVYGLVSSGIDSNGKITMIETSDGYLFLIAAVLALLFSFIKNLEKWAWIFGGIIVLLGILDLYNIVNYVNSLYSKAPIYKDFISFGAGIFVLLLGGVLVLISRLFLNKPLSGEALSDNTIAGHKVKEENERFTVSFQAKNENTWSNIKIKLLEFYKLHNFTDVISDKETSWMLGSNEAQGYVEAKLNEDIITIVSFKILKPDMSIIESETKKQEDLQTQNENQALDTIDNTAKLIEIGKMFESGLLSKDEFENIKSDLMKEKL